LRELPQKEAPSAGKIKEKRKNKIFLYKSKKNITIR
jgi:hypothetical protein